MVGRLPGLGYQRKHFRNGWETAGTVIMVETFQKWLEDCQDWGTGGSTSEMPRRLPGLRYLGKHYKIGWETARIGILGRQSFYETLKTKETARTRVLGETLWKYWETARTGLLGETLWKCLGDCQDWDTGETKL